MADHSRARLFFNEVIENGQEAFALLESLINGGESAAENGWREYKEAGFIGKTGNAEKEVSDVKRLWAENLSSFANTAGGILIWGIQTNGKIPDKLSLAKNSVELANLLSRLTIDATDPYVAGVEVESVTVPSDPKAGFVVCYIPPSTSAPHQAQWGERTYFVRVQDSNLPCPQPLLRSMFYPRVRSRLEPVISMTACAKDGAYRVSLQAKIANHGPATAEMALISVEARDLAQATIATDVQWEEIAASLFRYRYPIPPNFMAPHLIRIGGVAVSSGASAAFRFFAHNTPAHHSSVCFSQEEVLECVRSKNYIERRGRSDPIFP
jgi:hypothetical protein